MDKQRMNKEREGWNNMSDGEKIKALVDEGGMDEESAYWFLVDCGEIMNEKCMCESSLCHHHLGDANCDSFDTQPAPVMYLQGEPMCKTCIKNYIDGGYGIEEK